MNHLKQRLVTCWALTAIGFYKGEGDEADSVNIAGEKSRIVIYL